MRFVFLSHWGAERMSTTERLAVALGRAGHSILHVVAPCRNPVTAWRYNRAPHPLPSVQLWSPAARPAPAGRVDVFFAQFQAELASSDPAKDQIVVLQSPRLLPLARQMAARRRVFAALDVLPEVDDGAAIDWADVVFCLSPFQEAVLRERHRGKSIVNLGQCGRFESEFRGTPDETPTIVYVGLDQPYLLREQVRRLARLPARLLLVGCDARAAFSIFGGPPPGNVEPLAWLSGDAFARAICRGWVGVLPYDPTHPRVRQSNPDKVYDYLMAGLQVIATEVPALVDAPGITTVRPEDLEGAVRGALAAHGPEVAQTQRQLGTKYSPQRFADEFLLKVVTVSGGSTLAHVR